MSFRPLPVKKAMQKIQKMAQDYHFYRCPDYLLTWPFPLICERTLYTSQKDLLYMLEAESFTP